MSASGRIPPISDDPRTANDQTRELLKFLREENDKCRAAVRDDAESNRKLLLDTVKFVSFPLGVVLLILGWLGFKSVDDLKRTIQSEAKRETQAEVTRMQGEIRQRLSGQFQAPELQKTVREAAVEATKTAAAPLIKNEVAVQVMSRVNAERPTIVATVMRQTKAVVRQMEPRIDSLVKDSVDARVQRQVEPVVQKVKDLKNASDLQELILAMKNDDAAAFDELDAVSRTTSDVAARALIESSMRAVIQDHEKDFGPTYRFPTEVQHSDADLLEMLSDPDSYKRRVALWVLKDSPKLSLQRAAGMAISDESLVVRCQAARILRDRTNQHFGCLQTSTIRDWWHENKVRLESTSP